MTLNHHPHFKLKQIDLSDDTTVAASGTNTQSLTPPAGKIYRIISILYVAPDPSGSSSGTHELEWRYNGFTQGSSGRLGFVQGNTGSGISVSSNRYVGNASEVLSSETLQHQLITLGCMYCSSTYTIDFKYDNDTDVSQTGTRTLLIMVLEYDEAT
jgi:hypothetical protein